MTKLKQSLILAACVTVLLWLPSCTAPEAPPDGAAAQQEESAEDAGHEEQQSAEHEHQTFEPAPPKQEPIAEPVEPEPAPEPVEPAPPEPVWIQLEVPPGTPIAVEFDDPLSSETNLPGDVFHARVVEAVVIDGREVIPVGSTVQGVVEDARSGAHWDKGGLLVLRFNLIRLPTGEAVPLVASLTSEADSAGKKKKAGIIGGSAVGGAILGKILGKDSKDAAIGAIVGGAIGTGVLAAQKGEEVQIPVASTVFITVEEVFRVSVPD